jgi:hypothetical protein
MKDTIIAILILIGMSIFALGTFILAQHKNEIWEELRKILK